MSLAYKRNPPQRWPLTQPLYGESYLQATHRLRHLVDHWRRVDYAISKVDDGPPRCVNSVKAKLKRLLTFGESIAKLEHENRQMLKEILKVMNGPGDVDHFHKKALATHTSSLNFVLRRRMVARINEENKQMLRRIMLTKTSYDHVDLELEYRKTKKGRKGRVAVFKLWNKLARQRKVYITSGKFFTHGYDEIDCEQLHARFVETHRQCFPSDQYEQIQPLPVPRSCRSPFQAPPTDHQRCFVATPIVPPVTGHHRVPAYWPEAMIPVRENKTLKLRLRGLHDKMEVLKPKPAVVRSRSPSPMLRRVALLAKAEQDKALEAKAKQEKAEETEPKKRKLKRTKAQKGEADQVKTEQGEAGQGVTDQGEAGQNVADKGVTDQGIADQGEASQGIADQTEGGQCVAVQGEGGQNIADQGEGQVIADQGEGGQNIADQGEGQVIADQGEGGQNIADQGEGQGVADQGEERQDIADQGEGDQGGANQGEAEQGEVNQGIADQGEEGQAIADQQEANQGEENPGEAGQEEANPGEAGQEEANPGEAGQEEANPGEAGQEEANPGEAGQEEANPGEVGQGEANQGEEEQDDADQEGDEGGNNSNFNQSATAPAPQVSPNLRLHIGQNNGNVNQNAVLSSRRCSTIHPSQSSPYAKPIVLDKLLPLRPVAARAKTLSNKQVGNVEKVKKKNCSKQEAKLPASIWSLSSLKGSLASLEKDARSVSRVSETVCSMPVVKSGFPGQRKKAGDGGKKKECTLPKISTKSGKFTLPPSYAANSLGDGCGIKSGDLCSGVLHPYEQKANRMPRLDLSSSTKKVGWAGSEKGRLRGTQEASNSDCMTPSAKLTSQEKDTNKAGTDGINKVSRAPKPPDKLTCRLSYSKRSVAGPVSKSRIKSFPRSGASTEECSHATKFQKSQKQRINPQIKRGALANESDHQVVVRLEDRSQTSAVQLVERSKSQTSDVQLVEMCKSQNNVVKLVDRSKSQNNEVQLMDRSKSQNNDVQLVDLSKSRTPDVQLVDRSKSQISDAQPQDRPEFQTHYAQLVVHSPKSYTSGVQLAGRSTSQASDVQLKDRFNSQTSDVHRPKSQASALQLVHVSKSKTSDVQLVDMLKPQTSDVQLLHRSKSQTSDVQLVHRPKSQVSGLQLVHKSKSHASAQQLVHRPKSQTFDVHLMRWLKSQTSDMQLEDRPESQTCNVHESKSSAQDDLTSVSACSMYILHSLGDGGNTTDDAEDFPESDSEELFPK